MKTALKSLLAVIIGIMFFACSQPTDVDLLAGNWKRMGVDSIDLKIEFKKEGTWLYFKDDKLLEEGTFELKDQKMTLKHKVEEHHGHDHNHKHPEDHIYDYSFLKENKELQLVMGEKKTLYKKL